MNVPNILTLSRFGFALILMLLLIVPWPFAKTGALLIFAIGGLTDYLDGYLARNHYGVSSFGKMMDPLADKVMVSAALITFVELRLDHYDNPNASLVPAFLVVIIIAREFGVTGLRLLAASKGTVISAGKWGKHKTVWQIVAIVLILMGLAIREDIMPYMIGDPESDAAMLAMMNFDFAFHWLALVVSIAVSFITVISGANYFYEHRELIMRNV
jgi:CDP-diacylglycerol--glycerol-3-phosphate 3-phosphatidyltransferase